MPTPELKFSSVWLASAAPDEAQDFIGGLSDNALLALPHLFEFWALNHQLPPDTCPDGSAWRTWVIMGGRGAGKTRAGAEWVRAQVEGARPSDAGRCRRVALVGQSLDHVREVMVFGESGLHTVTPPDRKPEWHATRRLLTWPNGATASLYSAHDPDSLRGPQFDCAWSDELAAWEKGGAAWTMLQFALRLGEEPRQVVTTTPKNVPILKEILAERGTVLTQAATSANRAYLSRSFLENAERRYRGTTTGRQEFDGELLEDADHALWTRRVIDGCRRAAPARFDRIVVAVDPPAGGGQRSDACGIVVAGVVAHGPPADWHAWVIEDASIAARQPREWVQAALSAMERHGADRLVAEVNMGGQMIEELLRVEAPGVPFRAVRATRNKQTRAEPAAALYELGRVHHAGVLDALEAEMCAMTAHGYAGAGSPDRADALVWALHDLLIEPAGRLEARPSLRWL